MAATDAGTGRVSFFEKVGAELKKLFKHVPGWEASATATLTYIAPLVETLIAITDPEAAPGVTLLLQKIQSAMAAAAVVMKDAGPVPTLLTYLNAITNDLSQIEAAANVKDAASAQKLTATIAIIMSEVSAILSSLPTVSI